MGIDVLGLDYVFDPSKRLYWVYLLSSAFIAVIYLHVRPKRLSFVFSRHIWWHKSARLDYLYFMLSSLIKLSLLIPFVMSAEEMTRFLYTQMALHFDYVEIHLPQTIIIALYTFSIFIVSDFTRYWLHRWLHTVKFLWRFHRVHHSARVLTPFTFYRVHPVENFLFGVRYALSSGFVTALFIYLFGTHIHSVDILGVNAFVVVFMALGSNLRHSHVALKFYSFIEYVLMSPAQHQLHHANATMDKNYGGSLSVWDYMFGSLALSSRTKMTRFGLKAEQMKSYESIWGLFMTPFGRKQ